MNGIIFYINSSEHPVSLTKGGYDKIVATFGVPLCYQSPSGCHYILSESQLRYYIAIMNEYKIEPVFHLTEYANPQHWLPHKGGVKHFLNHFFVNLPNDPDLRQRVTLLAGQFHTQLSYLLYATGQKLKFFLECLRDQHISVTISGNVFELENLIDSIIGPKEENCEECGIVQWPFPLSPTPPYPPSPEHISTPVMSPAVTHGDLLSPPLQYPRSPLDVSPYEELLSPGSANLIRRRKRMHKDPQIVTL
jgi:hypothetical protein